MPQGRFPLTNFWWVSKCRNTTLKSNQKIESHMRVKIFQKFPQGRDCDRFRCLLRRSSELGETSGSAASFVEPQVGTC